MNQITLDDHRILDADIDLNYLSAFGSLNCPYLQIPIILKLRPLKIDNKDYGIFSLSANLYIARDNRSRTKLSSAETNDISPHKVVNEPKLNVYFEFPLTRFSLREIESYRIKDAKFIIELHFQFSKYQNDTIHGFENRKLEIEFSVPQSQWIEKVNNKLGYFEYFLIEFPKGKKTIPEIWKKLDEAETNFQQFDVSALFVKCREIGSTLDNYLKKSLGSKSFVFKERWRRSYDKFSHYCSLPLHLEDMKGKSNSYSKEEIKILKHDCEHVLLLTKSLMKYAEELLSEKSAE